jgi:hypothetical protein
MAYTVKKVEMWTGELEDRAGGLEAKLEPLAKAGVDLEVTVARRRPESKGKGVVFLGPLKGAKAQKAAAAAGLSRATDLVALQVEGPNRPGAFQRLTRLIADAGINLRGVSALSMGKKFLASFAFDSDADAAKARGIIIVGGKGK